MCDYIILKVSLFYLIISQNYDFINSEKKFCDMLIAIDEPLYDMYNRDMKKLTEMTQLHIENLNKIYHQTVFTGHYYENIYFQIKEIKILFDFCQLEKCNNHNSFLVEFSKLDTSSFCLAHLFTFRDFSGGIQGLGYLGVICNSKINTGFSTFINFNVRST